MAFFTLDMIGPGTPFSLDRIAIWLYGNTKMRLPGVSMKQFIKVMKALSDPSRVKILKILQLKELCVCEIKSLLDLAQPTISKHLKLLEEAGLVESRKEKLWVNYRLASGSDSIYAQNALQNLQGWLGDDSEVKSLLKMVPIIDRENICK